MILHFGVKGFWKSFHKWVYDFTDNSFLKAVNWGIVWFPRLKYLYRPELDRSVIRAAALSFVSVFLDTQVVQFLAESAIRELFFFNLPNRDLKIFEILEIPQRKGQVLK